MQEHAKRGNEFLTDFDIEIHSKFYCEKSYLVLITGTAPHSCLPSDGNQDYQHQHQQQSTNGTRHKTLVHWACVRTLASSLFFFRLPT